SMNAAYIATTAATAIDRDYSPGTRVSALGRNEQAFSLFAQQDPERVDAERGAVGKEQQIDGAERERRDARPGLVPPERHADNDVSGAPDERDDRERREDGRREAGRNLSVAPAVRGREQRERADAERERRH